MSKDEQKLFSAMRRLVESYPRKNLLLRQSFALRNAEEVLHSYAKKFLKETET